MWWYPLIDTVIIVGGSLAVLVTILRNIPWLLIALALGAAFWFYGPVEAMLGPMLKPAPAVARRDPPPAPPVTYAPPPAPAPAPVYTAPPTVYVPPPVYAYTAPTLYAGRTVMLFPHAFGGHAFGGHRR